MRILILTQYYLPETGAPQNRLSSLAMHLQALGADVEVLTALPNYPKFEIYPGYSIKDFQSEKIQGIPVHRCKIYVNKQKRIYYRLRNYFSFCWNAWRQGRKNLTAYDIILCESPPLFLGITAILLKRKWHCRFIFNVSDLWPESAEKMGIIRNKWLIRISYKLAHWIYKNADLISGQTKGILQEIDTIQPGKKLYWFPNGVDEADFSATATSEATKENKFTLLYAGILGHAQGLEVILHAAKKLENYPAIQFILIGDGPEKEKLSALQTVLGLHNVTFLPNQPRASVLEKVQACDAYIVPLKRLDIFKGAIPSKLFEPLAYGKPILLGVDGEARQLFIEEGKAGIYFEPENADALADAILHLYEQPALREALGTNGKTYVMKNFDRRNIATRFYQQMQQWTGEK